MTRQLHLLTARTVAGLKDPGRYADGGNLYLRVSPTGAKRWTFLYTIGTKKNRELGLGSAGTVTLAFPAGVRTSLPGPSISTFMPMPFSPFLNSISDFSTSEILPITWMV